MATVLLLILFHFSSVLVSVATPLNCKSHQFSSNRVFATCSDLPRLSSSLHWTYYANSSTLSIAFVAPPASQNGWVSWAINPTGNGMIGAQTLVAFKQPDGSMGVKTYDIKSYGPLKESSIAFETSGLAAENVGGMMRLFGTLKLPAGTTSITQVWQVGSSVSGGVPNKHGFGTDNLESKGKLDLVTGEATVTPNTVPNNKKIHGILNAVSWGILLPIGAIFARYLKTFKSADPAWFYLHISCQIIGYAVGIAGGGTGFKLGSQSGVTYTTHRNIGITLFVFCTLQVFALFLRPQKDHKYRIYWNAYHHSVGYSVIILGVINVFKGLHILNIDYKWTIAYITAICILGAFALVLEIVTWIRVLKSDSAKPRSNNV